MLGGPICLSADEMRPTGDMVARGRPHEPYGKPRSEVWSPLEFEPVRIGARVMPQPRNMQMNVIVPGAPDPVALVGDEAERWWDGIEPIISFHSGGVPVPLTGAVHVCKHCHLLYFVPEAA